MPRDIDISIVVITYQQPWHLARVLESIRLQTLADRLEVVISDDGSRDETPTVVSKFASQVDFPVSFVTASHQGFRPAVCRNRGVAKSRAPYLLLLDGDCLIPPDHVERHWENRHPRRVTNTYCVRFDEATSQQIGLEQVRNGRYIEWAPASELRKLRTLHRKSWFYNLINHPRRPTLRGGNVGLLRSTYERVNGMDENFRGWGGEDDDFGFRLRAAGVRLQYILDQTRTYHLWHPSRRPERIQDSPNTRYLHRPDRAVRCRNGLRRHAA